MPTLARARRHRTAHTKKPDSRETRVRLVATRRHPPPTRETLVGPTSSPRGTYVSISSCDRVFGVVNPTNAPCMYIICILCKMRGIFDILGHMGRKTLQNSAMGRICRICETRSSSSCGRGSRSVRARRRCGASMRCGVRRAGVDRARGDASGARGADRCGIEHGAVSTARRRARVGAKARAREGRGVCIARCVALGVRRRRRRRRRARTRTRAREMYKG